MAKAIVHQIGFCGTALREPGETIDMDPTRDYAPSGWFTYVDATDQKRAEAAYRERLCARFENQIAADIEARVRADAEAQLRAAAEKKVKSKLADSKAV